MHTSNAEVWGVPRASKITDKWENTYLMSYTTLGHQYLNTATIKKEPKGLYRLNIKIEGIACGGGFNSTGKLKNKHILFQHPSVKECTINAKLDLPTATINLFESDGCIHEHGYECVLGGIYVEKDRVLKNNLPVIPSISDSENQAGTAKNANNTPEKILETKTIEEVRKEADELQKNFEAGIGIDVVPGVNRAVETKKSIDASDVPLLESLKAGFRSTTVHHAYDYTQALKLDYIPGLSDDDMDMSKHPELLKGIHLHDQGTIVGATNLPQAKLLREQLLQEYRDEELMRYQGVTGTLGSLIGGLVDFVIIVLIVGLLYWVYSEIKHEPTAPNTPPPQTKDISKPHQGDSR